MKKLIIKKNIWIFLLLLFCIFPIQKINAQDSNAGFIPGNIWYSTNSFEEGDTIKIYTVVFNPDTRELSGSVVFFDNNIYFAKKDFTVSAKSVKDVSIDWKVTAGDHSIFGKIENAKFLISPGKYEEVYLAINETSKSSRTVAKKITPTSIASSATDTIVNSIISSTLEAGSNSVKNIGNTIGDNTPDFIAQPVVATTNAVEEFRKDIATASKEKRAEVQKKIDQLGSNKTVDSKKSTKTLTADDFMKPLMFTELFALALFSNIFDNRFIFYTLLFLFTFLLLYYLIRYIKRKRKK